ncbi:MAG: hypothetical protein ACLP5H_03300 [Desulfomonilaceae bacterium]
MTAEIVLILALSRIERYLSEASIQLPAANEVLVNGSRESVEPASCRSIAGTGKMPALLFLPNDQ